MGAFESGQAFMNQVLAKLPADKQAAAKALFDDPVAKDAVALVGDGALARTDYSKAMDDLKKRQDELTDWYSQNEEALKEYVEIKPKFEELSKVTTTTTEKKEPVVDPRKAAEDLLAEQGPHFLQASAWLAAKAIAHQRLFNEELDVVALTTDPRLGREVKGQPGRVVSLPDLYNEKFGEKVAAKQKEAEEARFTAEVDKRFKERMAQQASSVFPLRGQSEASVLDTLSEKDGSAKHTLDTATALYDELQANRA